MSIQIESLNLGGLIAEVEAVTPEALLAAGELVGKLAQEKTPVLVNVKQAGARANPGALRDSMYVRLVGGVTAEVGFSEFYAGWVHEWMHSHHDIGEAKYLELALLEGKEAALEVIAVEVRKALGA